MAAEKKIKIGTMLFKNDEHPYFKKNIVMQCYEKVVAGIDGFLEGQGYRHEGRRFLCTQENSKTIALFSHGGSGGAALSHILSLPFPYVLCVFPYNYTSVIAVDFPSQAGCYVHPRVELFNDAAHIKGLGDELKIQQKSN
jgi:probable phosphoglycerate mutase